MFSEKFHANEWTELHTEAEADELARLVDMCNSDPAHVRKAEPTTEELTAAQYGELDVINWHNRVTFDVRAIGENIKARSAELKAQIEARMREAEERSPFRL